MQLIEFLNTYLLGTCLPPFLLAAGLFFAVHLAFFPFRHPVRFARRMRTGGGRSSLSALAVALAGTLNRDREKMIAQLESALKSGKIRPERYRRL